MAIDPSIALSANSGGGNLLQTLAGATQLRGVQQQQQANIAASQAYKNATDPVTGQIDYNALTAALAQGPAAYNLPQIQGQINEARNSALNYDKGKLELAQKRTDLLSGGFGGLLAKGSFQPADVMGIASQGIRLGLFTPEEAIAFTSDMPTDPSQLQNWAKQKYVGFSTDAEKLKTLMPQIQTINTGGQQIITPINPLTGGVEGQQSVFNNTMAPGDANSLVPVFDPTTNTMRQVTKAQAAAMANGQMMPPGAAPSAVGGSGRYPGQPQPAPGGMPSASGTGLQAAPSLGASAAADVLGKGAGEAVVKLQDTASGAPDRIRFLQDMTSNLNHFESGPTSNWTAQAKALALQLAPGMAAQVGVDPQAVASKEEFTKYAAQLAMSSMKGMGSGTDSQLATTVSGNPHAELSKLGLQQIMQVMTGVERANLAKNAAWQAAGVQPQNYSKWEAAWNKDIDPRVFVTPEMSQPEVSKMYKALKPADQARFKTSLRTAIDAGIIPNPVGQ